MLTYRVLEEITTRINSLDNLISFLQWEFRVNKVGAVNHIENVCLLEEIKWEILSSDLLADYLNEAKEESSFFWLAHLAKHSRATPHELIRPYVSAKIECEKNWILARQSEDHKILPSFAELIKLTKEVSQVKLESFLRSDSFCTQYDILVNFYDPSISSKELDELFIILGSFFRGHENKEFKQPLAEDFDLMGILTKILELFKLTNARKSFDWLYYGNLLGANQLIFRLQGNNEEATWFYNWAGSVMHEIGRFCTKGTGAESLYGAMFYQRCLLNPILRQLKINSAATSNSAIMKLQSDEINFNAHIMLRYALEKEIIEGKLSPEDVPEAWSSGTMHYFHNKPKNHNEGYLQDPHWFSGAFGLFPLYSRGQIIAHKIKEELQNAHNPENPSDPLEEFRLGKTCSLGNWVNDNLARFKQISSEDLNHYMGYLQEKQVEMLRGPQ